MYDEYTDTPVLLHLKTSFLIARVVLLAQLHQVEVGIS